LCIGIAPPGNVWSDEADDSPAAPAEFPDGISPNDVYRRMDLLDRSVDRLLVERKLEVPQLAEVTETELGPLHVYQMVLACAIRLQEFADQTGVLAVPTMSVRPRIYAPRDVFLVTTLLLENVRHLATEHNIDDMPGEEKPLADKTPTDVFLLAAIVFTKLNALCGYRDISPNEVYAEMVRGADDVRSILQQSDPECRYRVDAPASEENRKPADVFKKCLAIRRLINEHRKALNMPITPLPASIPPDNKIFPRDVFLQTQLIIAELNLLKLRTDTVSSTPLPIPVKRTLTPTDVYGQANILEYLLRQVQTGAVKVGDLERTNNE
jgi:hypothetical protein